MSALRFVSVLALAIWLGGMVTIGGVVAPAVFAVLGPSDAAPVVGEILRRFHVVGYAAGALLLLSLALIALIGPRPRAFWVRLTMAGVMLAATLVAGMVVDRRIAAMRAEIGVPIRSLARGDARRAAFGRLHATSTALMGVAVAAGLVLAFLDARDAR
jgi:uncharacterized membrane protein